MVRIAEVGMMAAKSSLRIEKITSFAVPAPG